MKLIYRILYGSLYDRYWMRDYILKYFKKVNYVEYKVIYNDSAPPELDGVIEFFSAEGMIITDRYGIRITDKGKAMSESGGYLKQLLLKRITFVAVVVGAIGAITTITIALCSQFKTGGIPRP